MELRNDVPDRAYCDDVLFELFYGSGLNPEKYLKNKEDIDKVNEARNVINEYLKTLEENHLTES